MAKDRIEFNEAYGEWWIMSGDTDELLVTCDTYKEAQRLMLAALELALDTLTPARNDEEAVAVRAIRAAIAKAEGES